MNEYLRRYRLQQGLTIQQLSEKAYVSAGYISKIEQGKCQPSILIASCLFAVLGVKFEVILPKEPRDLFSLSRETGIPLRQLLEPVTDLATANLLGATIKLTYGREVTHVAYNANTQPNASHQ